MVNRMMGAFPDNAPLMRSDGPILIDRIGLPGFLKNYYDVGNRLLAVDRVIPFVIVLPYIISTAFKSIGLNVTTVLPVCE
jgi:hypothetical protein